MSKVFFISDPHFGHKNLETLRQMPVEESDALIISNWNKVVTKYDLVYILGDITMEKPKLISSYLSQLTGNIRVIGGNHDKRASCQVLQSLGIVVMGCLEYRGFICTHFPVHPIEVYERYWGNIHGHIHEPKIDLGAKYLNVACEHIHYTPIDFDSLLDKYHFKQNYNNE